jgi:hypothetical protein
VFYKYLLRLFLYRVLHATFPQRCCCHNPLMVSSSHVIAYHSCPLPIRQLLAIFSVHTTYRFPLYCLLYLFYLFNAESCQLTTYVYTLFIHASALTCAEHVQCSIFSLPEYRKISSHGHGFRPELFVKPVDDYERKSKECACLVASACYSACLHVSHG